MIVSRPSATPYRTIARTLRSGSMLAALLSASVASAATAQSSAAAPRPSFSSFAAPAGEAISRLQSDVDRIVRAMGGGATRSSVLVVSLDRGDTLVSLNADLPLAPASNLKLYSTGAALYYLGPDFRYSTSLLADGPVRDGVLEGDLILHGNGDPTISGRMLPSGLSTFIAFADSLAALGVRRVRGNLMGDGSYFDEDWIGDGWQPGDRMEWYAAPIGALNFSENMVTVRVQPGASGDPARITTAPATVGMAIVNRVRTVRSGSTSVRFEHGDSAIVVSGEIRRGASGVSRMMPVVDPANYAAAALRAVLQERGIRVDGEVRSVRRPAESRVGAARAGVGSPPRVVAVHRSPPLAEIAAVTNHVSHNLFAEALLKTAGRVVEGEGSFAAGARAVTRLVDQETAVAPAALRIEDGSGLSRTNRVTARATVSLLDYMMHSAVWNAYYESLPEAADARGLHRMYDTPAARNLRAKTGTIRNVSALSGYVRTADGERLMFCIMTNGIPATAQAKDAENRIGARLARFTRRE
jgi:serine-type D-Ala-D-Ala carboxypeptidase/endopeptidase (penicillin-binding protein 4)